MSVLVVHLCLLMKLICKLSLFWWHAQAVRAAQKQRQKLMTEMCKKYLPANNKINSRHYPDLISSDRQQFLYCVVPKVEYRYSLSIFLESNKIE